MGTLHVLKILKDARDLISDRERWTQRAVARDAEGVGVGSLSCFAVCWCSSGALAKVGQPGPAGEPVCDLGAWDALDEEMGRVGVATFNDHNSHDAVIAAFDRAIAKLEADAKTLADKLRRSGLEP